MPKQTISRLIYLCNTLPELLKSIPESEFTHKPQPGKWSKKEILGHLIDSAANNHQRFVRVQFEREPVIFYEQNQWNKYSYGNHMKSETLIAFWTQYNKYLAELMEKIPSDFHKNYCVVGNNEKVTLEFLMKDYVSHLEHHLKQIVKY